MIPLAKLCRFRTHCAWCRDRAHRRWRERLGRIFVLPPGEPDFECPHGLPWGAGEQTGLDRPAPKGPATKAEVPDDPQAQECRAARQRICDDCDEWNGNACEKNVCCRATWRKYLGKPESTCPLGKWPPIGE